MLIEEEEGKSAVEVNPDALVAAFEDDSIVDEDMFVVINTDDEDEVDIAFEPNPENYW